MELNEKLARWAGFYQMTITGEHWYATDGMAIGKTLIDFTSSLDACFKWLVPAWNNDKRPISEWIENIIFCLMSGTLIRCTIQSFDVEPDVWEDGDTPALALCKAIEQLIDKETNGN